MKVVITGHTRGIGKAIAEVFSNNNFEIIGFSKSAGYDISDQSVRQQILNASVDADVFINNAYDHVGQTELLKGIIEQWEGTDKFIVNMSSKLVFFPGDPAAFGEFFETYIEDKKLQNKIISDRHHIALPMLLNVMPGLVETEMAGVFDAKKLEPSAVANTIFNLYKSKDSIAVQEIIVDVPGLNWENIKINL